MIAQLSGTVLEIDGNGLIVDVSGVGYEIICSHTLIGNAHESSQTTLYIYEHIREQEHTLYGFESKADRLLFEALLSVNGVGPKAALAIFNLASPVAIQDEIRNGNVAFLTQASGVGKKAAERVIVDLQDKMGSGATKQFSRQPINDEATEGLMALGYTKDQAQTMLADTEGTTESRIKQALKKG